jgi:hypothetical protein
MEAGAAEFSLLCQPFRITDAFDHSLALALGFASMEDYEKFRTVLMDRVRPNRRLRPSMAELRTVLLLLRLWS